MGPEGAGRDTARLRWQAAHHHLARGRRGAQGLARTGVTGRRAALVGPNKGASFFYVANAGSPFFVADNWVRYFVTRDPGLDTTHLTYRQFFKIFRESQKRFHSVIGSDDPDLSAFARAGGISVSYHGQSDELVPTQGTVDYRKRVNRELAATRERTTSTACSCCPASTTVPEAPVRSRRAPWNSLWTGSRTATRQPL